MPAGPKKPSRKRKAVEEKVLEKARKFVKLQVDEPDEESSVTAAPAIKLDRAPRVKLRKPRWDQDKIEERKKELEGKAKQPEDKPVSEDKSKPKGKKKKKKRKKQQPEASGHVDVEHKHRDQALKYLQTWSTNRNEWKFEKLKQIWLLKHSLDTSDIGPDDFETLLNYIQSIQGKARAAIMTEMVKLVEDYDKQSSLTKEDMSKYERARQILQMLHD